MFAFKKAAANAAAFLLITQGLIVGLTIINQLQINFLNKALLLILFSSVVTAWLTLLLLKIN